MTTFPVSKDLDEALTNVRGIQHDALGYARYTFRIELSDPEPTADSILVELIDRGWQMVTGPVVVESSARSPRHTIFSMIHSEPRTLRIQGRMEIQGEVQSYY